MIFWEVNSWWTLGGINIFAFLSKPFHPLCPPVLPAGPLGCSCRIFAHNLASEGLEDAGGEGGKETGMDGSDVDPNSAPTGFFFILKWWARGESCTKMLLGILDAPSSPSSLFQSLPHSQGINSCKLIILPRAASEREQASEMICTKRAEQQQCA